MTLTLTADSNDLILWGAILFLIGLLQGLLIPAHKNTRMALSAHLAAVQSGMALIIFGVIWALLNLSPMWLHIAKISLIVSMYLIWVGITIAAITGASKALPIAGEGHTAGATSERLVYVLEALGSLLAIVGGVLIVAGLVF